MAEASSAKLLADLIGGDGGAEGIEEVPLQYFRLIRGIGLDEEPSLLL